VSLVVLLILALVWAVFLVPQLLRARAEKTPADSIGAFRNQLSVLERATPAIGARRLTTSSAPALRSPARATRNEARRRRQAILVRLLGAMALTFVLGLLVHPMLYVHVTLDVLFVAYCALLWRAQALAVERDTKVRYLRGPSGQHQPAPLLLQRSGS